MYSEGFSFRKLPQAVFSKSCGKGRRELPQLMWNGLDQPQPGRDEGGRDGCDGSSAATINLGPVVEPVTTSVAELAVDAKGESRSPNSQHCITQPARGNDSNPLFAFDSVFI